MFMIAFLKILDVQIVIPTKVYIQWLTVIVEVVAVFVMVVAILQQWSASGVNCNNSKYNNNKPKKVKITIME